MASPIRRDTVRPVAPDGSGLPVRLPLLHLSDGVAEVLVARQVYRCRGQAPQAARVFFMHHGLLQKRLPGRQGATAQAAVAHQIAGGSLAVHHVGGQHARVELLAADEARGWHEEIVPIELHHGSHDAVALASALSGQRRPPSHQLGASLSTSTYPRDTLAGPGLSRNDAACLPGSVRSIVYNKIAILKDTECSKPAASWALDRYRAERMAQGWAEGAQQLDSMAAEILREYEHWLLVNDLHHGDASRAQFMRCYPMLFGRDLGLVQRGYARWLSRERLPDSAQNFARYCAPRYRRRAALGGDLLATERVAPRHEPGQVPCVETALRNALEDQHGAA